MMLDHYIIYVAVLFYRQAPPPLDATRLAATAMIMLQFINSIAKIARIRSFCARARVFIEFLPTASTDG